MVKIIEGTTFKTRKYVDEYFETECVWYQDFSLLSEKLEKTGNIVESKKTLYEQLKLWLVQNKVKTNIGQQEFFKVVEHEIFPELYSRQGKLIWPQTRANVLKKPKKVNVTGLS